ncbi:MAG: FUSC family protein [Akkermansiaceae bacterium]|nr:FUSC family protein [Akkermansiaceae bacterium]
MRIQDLRQSLAGFLERESMSPDLNRAIRATVAFMIPLIATSAGWIHMDPVHACIAANTIALVDVRGGYSLRLGLLLAISVILTLAVSLAVPGVSSLVIAMLGTAVIVALGGYWRHLSTDYGPGLAVSSSLLFFISLAPPLTDPGDATLNPVTATLAGALFGTLLQVILWPIHPQHPLRRTVAESWMALADLLEAMSPERGAGGEMITQREVELRATLNRTQATLHAAKHTSGGMLRQLELLNIAAVRLGFRIIAFKAAFRSLPDDGRTESLSQSMSPALDSLTNLVRSVALAVVSRQASQWNLFEVRMKRVGQLLAASRARLLSHIDDPASSRQLAHLVLKIEEQLPIVRDALGKTMDRTDSRAAFPMELQDLRTLALRPLAASLNFAGKPDPALVRHTFRAVMLALIGVVFFKFSGFPHGYWVPFTMLVVLQPDFGSTREKAFQRMSGTLAGGLIASSILWLHPPKPVVLAAIAITIALFGFFQKRRYGIAVIFITLMVVLLMESHQPVTLAFTLERMGSTLAGGILALVAALIFWPAWERSRFPRIMEKALRSNLSYLQLTVERLRDGGPHDEPLVEAIQAAESANTDAFSSLKRMIADPKNQQAGLQQAAALANGNQRITQALSVIVLHLDNQKTLHPEALDEFRELCTGGYQDLIKWEETGVLPSSVEARLERLGKFRLPEINPLHTDPARHREPWIFPQLARIVTELEAMLLIVRSGNEG